MTSVFIRSHLFNVHGYLQVRKKSSMEDTPLNNDKDSPQVE